MNIIRFVFKRLDRMVIALCVTLLLSQILSGQTTVGYNSSGYAIAAAQNNKQYLFLLFYDKKGETLKVMESNINDFMNKSSEKILLYKALTTDDKEQDVVKVYGINRAPLPVLLVLAPNGAVTGGFPQKVSMDSLEKSIVPTVVMNSLKTVQAGKIALVLLQNAKTKFNNESSKAAKEFADDSTVKGYVDIIKADPSDPKNSDFISSVKLSKDITEAAVVFIIPPGSIAGVYSGKITKDTLAAALKKCSSGSGSGCCPK